MGKFFRFTFAIAWALAMPQGYAQDLAPDALIRKISDDVIASLRQDRAVQEGDARSIAALVETKILPHFDFRRATQIALGANWHRATPAQKEQLIREFRTLLVRTYSGALAAYRGHTIEVRPLRAGAADTEVTVRSQVRQQGAAPITIEYDMEKSGPAWKVYDVRISGMSLVATYRTTFAEEVHNHGIDGLIGALASKNRGSG